MRNFVSGRKFTIALPILALSACSVIEQPFVQSQNDVSYGYYNQSCGAGTCASGQSYSVAGANNAFGGAHAGSNHWPDQQLVAGYEGGGYGQGPVHVNPTGYGPHGAHHAQGYGQPPHLRGLRGPKRGNFYGTLGGVMYDTDLDSFGLEGRLGYDSGRIWGAEVEGSLGLIDEKETISGIDLETGFDYNLAAFALARLPLSNRFSLHARGGYDFRRLSSKGTDNLGATAEAELDLDGFAYGVGAEYALSPRDGLRLDLTRYDNEFGASDSVSASYTRKF